MVEILWIIADIYNQKANYQFLDVSTINKLIDILGNYKEKI